VLKINQYDLKLIKLAYIFKCHYQQDIRQLCAGRIVPGRIVRATPPGANCAGRIVPGANCAGESAGGELCGANCPRGELCGANCAGRIVRGELCGANTPQIVLLQITEDHYQLNLLIQLFLQIQFQKILLFIDYHFLNLFSNIKILYTSFKILIELAKN
jgi:hypothetical protein